MTTFSQLLHTISQYAWGIPSICLLVGTGLFLTLRLRFIQFRQFGHGLRLLFGKSDHQADGSISRFQALSTALSGTIGTGNIAGVATAIGLGGAGALFWMWVTALVGMATKYASCMLAVHFRQIDADGTTSGGPMFTIAKGLNMPKLGAAYALLTLIATFGIGCTVQANSIVGGLDYIIPHATSHTFAVGVFLALSVGIVILGGIRRIASVAGFMTPIMALAYCLAALLILALHITEIPHALWTIVNLALNPHAASAGMIGAAIQYGVARGVFSNEAGLGSAAIAHAAARTKDPVSQGFVAMLGPFIDTIIVCTMTGLVIVIVTQHVLPPEYQGAALSAFAFQQGLTSLHLGQLGAWTVGLGLVFFAYSTMIAWSYYGDRCAEFLLGKWAILPYRLLFTALILVGAIAPLPTIWSLADIANICMALPNLLSLLLLSGLVWQLSKNYTKKPR